MAVLDDRMAAELLAAARKAAGVAYAPYSGFAVGAAALTLDGTVITGCNVENASYPMTMCAERVAVGTALAAGHRALQAIAVSTPAAPGGTPCGACRQVLNEFVPRGGTLTVVLEGADGPEQVPLSSLLPRSFGPADLDRARESEASGDRERPDRL